MDEYRLAIGIVRMTQLMGKYHRAFYDDNNKPLQAEMLDSIIAAIPALVKELKRTWLLRNRYSYLDDSVTRLTNVLERAKVLRQGLDA